MPNDVITVCMAHFAQVVMAGTSSMSETDKSDERARIIAESDKCTECAQARANKS